MKTELIADSVAALFPSFMMGGFESASHRRRDRTQIDVAATTGHDIFAEGDYRLLISNGVKMVRDGLRWHIIEKSPGNYDWSTLQNMLEAAHESGMQVIWDLCHWGYPIDLDIFSAEFPRRFAAYAAAADAVIQEFKKQAGDTARTFYCPVNEISFWAWVGGDEEHFDPYQSGRGPELKRQLVRASIEAIRAIRRNNSSARFIQAEPIINISAENKEDMDGAARYTESQFEAWDMLAGMSGEEPGGSSDTLDIIGVNYYWNNQWVHEGDRTPPGHELHRPLHEMLYALWRRYSRPIVITETGAERGSEFAWLGHVSAEVRQAQRMGVPVAGICIYPVMDYPGWDDDRHCECGLIRVSEDWSARSLRADFCAEVRLQESMFQAARNLELSLSCAFVHPREQASVDTP